MRFRLPVVAALMVLAGAAAAEPAHFLVGNWYGEAQPEDPNVFWLAHFHADGRFDAVFRTCRGNDAADESDTGTWSYRPGGFEVNSTAVNGIPTSQVERYTTVSYDGRKHSYRHERTGFVFSAVRVSDGFELPLCGLSS